MRTTEFGNIMRKFVAKLCKNGISTALVARFIIVASYVFCTAFQVHFGILCDGLCSTLTCFFIYFVYISVTVFSVFL